MTITTTIGSASADSYATLAEYQTYAGNLGWYLSDTDELQEQHLRRACQWLDRQWIWRGSRVDATQKLEWPRVLNFIPRFDAISSTEIPQDVKDAQCEIAYVLSRDVDLLAPVTTLKRTERRTLPRVPAVEGLLAPYGEPRGSTVRLVRA